jgi:hypothetical protein
MAHKPTHVIVKARHPRIKQALYVLLAALVVAVGWGLFEYGRARAGFDARAARNAQDALLERITALEADNKRLSGQNAILEQARDIDRRAYDEVDLNLASLQDELLELKQEAAFYRRLVNSSSAAKGLQIESVKLQRDGDSPGYHYRLVLMQNTTQISVVQGDVRITVGGMKNGVQAELSQQDLLGADKTAMPFRFRHFQELAGTLTLPAGFVPLRLVLKVVPRDGGASLERVYNWSELLS